MPRHARSREMFKISGNPHLPSSLQILRVYVQAKAGRVCDVFLDWLRFLGVWCIRSGERGSLYFHSLEKVGEQGSCSDFLVFLDFSISRERENLSTA